MERTDSQDDLLGTSVWARLVALSFLDILAARGVNEEMKKKERSQGHDTFSTATTSNTSTTQMIYLLPLAQCSSLEVRLIRKGLGGISNVLGRLGEFIDIHHQQMVSSTATTSQEGNNGLRSRALRMTTPPPPTLSHELSSLRISRQQLSLHLLTSTGRPVTEKELKSQIIPSLASTFDHSLEGDGFSYVRLTKILSLACVEIIPMVVPELFPKTPELTIKTNVPFYDEFMIPYDYCFETNPAGCRISHPDFNLLSKSKMHTRWYFRHPAIASWKTRQHFAYISEVFMAIPHESIHIYQGVAKQRDTSKDKWSSEHDASVPSLTFLYALATAPKEMCEQSSNLQVIKQILANGVFEACVLAANAQEDCFNSELPINVPAEYEKLKRNFGALEEPAVESTENTRVASVFKSFLPKDWFFDSLPQFKLQLEMLFGDGRMDVDTFTRQPPATPQELAVTTPWLQRSPCTFDELAALSKVLF